jgi:hypothetical protein
LIVDRLYKAAKRDKVKLLRMVPFMEENMKSGKSYLLLLIILIVFVNAHHVYAREDFGDTLQRSFEVSPGGLLNLDTAFGSIEVKGMAGNTVDIKVLHKMRDFVIEFDKRGNDIYVTANFEGGIIRRIWYHLFYHAMRTRFVVTVPSQYNVDLKTSGGNISVDDLEGDVRSKTSGGNLHFNKIKGAVVGTTSGGSIELFNYVGMANVDTSGGNIRMSNVDGDVNAHTSGGPITIESVKGRVIADTSGGSIDVQKLMGSIDAKTSGGNIKAQILKQPNMDCRLATSGGNVVVSLEDGIAVDVDAETSGGWVETDFPVAVKIHGKIRGSALQGRINGGGPLIVLRTSGGNIHIGKK